MFIAANSAQLDSSADDLSASDFTTLFDSPITIHHADVELVSCSIRRIKKTTVIAGQNSLIVRIGDPTTSNQFQINFTPGTYTPQELATHMTEEMNAQTPIPQYRTWKVTVNASNELQIVHAGLQPRPNRNAQTFCLQPQNNGNMDGVAPEDSPICPFTTKPNGVTAVDVDGANIWSGTIGQANQPQLRVDPVEADGSPLNITRFCDNFFTFDNCVVFPNDGEHKIDINHAQGYRESVIDGIQGTDQTTNLFKYVPCPGDPLGILYNVGQGSTGTDKPDQCIVFKIRHETFIVTDEPGPAKWQYLMEATLETSSTYDGTTFNGVKNYFHMTVNGLGIMSIDPTPLDSSGNPTGGVSADRIHLMANAEYAGGPDTGPVSTLNQYIRSDAGFASQPNDPLKIGRWEMCVPGYYNLQNKRSCLYMNNAGLNIGYNAVFAPTTAGSGSIKYKGTGEGKFNYWNLDTDQPFINAGFKQRSGSYKILETDTNGTVLNLIITDPGEGYKVGDVLYLDDPNSIKSSAKKTAAQIRAGAATITLTSAMISQNYLGYGSGNNFAGLAMLATKAYPALSFGFTSKENADDPRSIVGGTPQMNYSDADVMVHFEPTNPVGGPTGIFKVSVTQMVHTDDGLNDKEQVVLVKEIRCNDWATELTLGGTAPGPLTNWATFQNGNTIRLIMDMRDVYNFEIKIEHDTAASPGVFVETQRIAGTGYTFTQANIPGTRTMMQTTRDISLPIIPILKLPVCKFTQGSSGNPADSNVSFKYDGRFAPVKKTIAQVAAGITAGDWTGYSMVGDLTAGVDTNITGTVVDGNDPRVVLKTTPLNSTQISTTPAPTGQVFEIDFEPSDAANFGLIGNLHSAYYIPQGTTGAARTFAAIGAINVIPFFGSYSIEMPDLPMNGWVGKCYDLGGEKRGIGQRGNILHIVTCDNNITSAGSSVSVYDYTAKFPMPVHVCLATPTDFQSLQFRLRNIETGELLQDLLHPSQIVFRIIPKDKK